jgi:transcriptional regulator NrdR family protein
VQCPTCRLPRRMVTIRSTIAGATVVMRSCSACDTRWWERDGVRVDPHEVMSAAAPRE